MQKPRILTAALTAAVLTGLAASQAHAAITDGLAVHLKFDGTYNNGIVNDVTAVPVGSPTFVAGKLGQGVRLNTTKDGQTNNYVTLGTGGGIAFGSGASAVDFSVAFWVKYASSADDHPFISNKNWGSGSNRGWGLFTQSGGNFKINYRDDVNARHDVTASQIIRDGNWHHIAMSAVRSGMATLFIDGTNAASVSIAPDAGKAVGLIDTIDLGYNLNLGQDGTGTYTDGGSSEIDMMMDDVGIWRRALSASEVAAIYTAGNGGSNLTTAVVAKVDTIALTPVADAKSVAANTRISGTFREGVAKVNTNTVVLKVDGTTVVPLIVRDTNQVTVTFSPTNLFLSKSIHKVALTFTDSGGLSYSNGWSFQILSYPSISPSLAVPANSITTADTGFLMRVYEIDGITYGNLPMSVNLAEAQLAGVRINPADNTPYPNATTPGPLAGGAFAVPGVLNFDINGPLSTGSGSFTTATGFTDSEIPGVGQNVGVNMGMEMIGYLSLPAGYQRFGINSDDGFRLTIGANPRDALGTELAVFDSSRSSADTIFDVVVPTAGIYPVRIIWFNAATVASFEFYSVDVVTGAKTLINDLADAKSIKAYRTSSAPYPPYVSYLTPAPYGTPRPSKTITMQLSNGSSTAVDANSVQLVLDGKVVSTTKTTGAGKVTLTYKATGLQLPKFSHTAQLTYTASGSASTNTWVFSGLKNYVLPSPFIFENFDSTAQGTFPTGWVEENFTGKEHPGIDFADANSDAYLGFTVISSSTLSSTFGARRLIVAPDQELNGVVYDANNPLLQGSFIYGDSDNRQNGPPGQIQYLTTPTYDLTGKTNIVIAFNSAYEQNQDSLAALEYTTDGGANWGPVLYWLQGPADGQGPSDILRDAAGNIDVVATMTTSYGDVARYTNSVGQLVGGTYGFFIKAPITQALAPYIDGRVNDDPTESKRIEVYYVPELDNKKTVKFRFVQAGTSSWYWGIDNWGIYSVADLVIPNVPSSGPIKLTVVRNGTSVSLTWSGGSGSYLLQKNTTVSTTGWTDVGSTTSNTSATDTVGATGSVFYRVIQK